MFSSHEIFNEKLCAGLQLLFRILAGANIEALVCALILASAPSAEEALQRRRCNCLRFETIVSESQRRGVNRRFRLKPSPRLEGSVKFK